MINKKYTLLVIAFLCYIAFVNCQSAEKEEVKQSVTLSPEARLEKIKLDLKEVKAELTQTGNYNCCIQPTCSWCVLHEGECECFDNLKGGKEVCPGCGLGWDNGQGVVEGIKASQVKWNITHEHPTGGHEH